MLWAGPSSDGSSLLGVVTQGGLIEAGGPTPKTAHAMAGSLGCLEARAGLQCCPPGASMPHKMVAWCQRPIFQEAGNECDQPLKDCA